MSINLGNLEEKTHFRCDPIRLSEHDENKIIYVSLGLIAEYSLYIKTICDAKKDDTIIDMPGNIDIWRVIMNMCVKNIDIETLCCIRRDILFFTLNKICFDKDMTEDLLDKCIASNKINIEETQWNLLPKEYLSRFVNKSYEWLNTDETDHKNYMTEYIEKNEFALHVVEQCNLYAELGKELQVIMNAFSDPKREYKIKCKKLK